MTESNEFFNRHSDSSGSAKKGKYLIRMLIVFAFLYVASYLVFVERKYFLVHLRTNDLVFVASPKHSPPLAEYPWKWMEPFYFFLNECDKIVRSDYWTELDSSLEYDGLLEFTYEKN